MKPRVQLPRASTTASLAKNTLPEPVTSISSDSQWETVADTQQILQAIQEIESFDTKKLFSGSVQADGRLCPGGPQVACTLRAIQADVASGKSSLEAAAAAFRRMCQAAILHWWTTDQQQALYANTLLNFGNERLTPLEAPRHPSNSSFAAAAAAQQASNFWNVAPDFANLMSLQYPKSALPPNYLQKAKAKAVEAQAASRKRQSTGGGGHQQKKAKAGTRTQQQGSNALSQDPELSAKLQKRLASMLQLVAAPSEALKTEGSQAENSGDVPLQAAGPTHAGGKGVEGHANRIRKSSAAEQTQPLSISFSNVVQGLQAGLYQDPELLKQDVQEICHAAAEAYCNSEQDSGLRRGKIVAAAEQFAQLVAGAVDTVIGQSISSKAALKQGSQTVTAAVVRQVPLPASIIANHEPFRQGDWHKEPYPARAYKHLTEYELAEEEDLLRWKLLTTKPNGCDGQNCHPGQLGTYNMEQGSFNTQCPCLALNRECDASCACRPPRQAGDPEGCANRAVSSGHALQMGRDVQEIDAWGLDCYSRRNILDAILESQAFGAYEGKGDTAPAQPSGALSDTPGQIAGVHLDAATPAGHAMQQASHQDQHGAAVPDEKPSVKAVVSDWIDQTLLPAINAQGQNGWDILQACDAVKKAAQASNDQTALKAAIAVHKRASRVGHDFFRIHPKGKGVICLRPEGLPALTFVEEYLGEMHAPWRWFEIQDAIKKSSKDELPDFYNIMLERPKDDTKGYDVMFVDAASQGNFASRISHSCNPNCQAQVMACGGRLTIALYTMRPVAFGEELSFDYACVTESEREFRAAICLCGTQLCRGSFLYFSGSKAFMQIMSREHNMLQRQALILKAGTYPLTTQDQARLQSRGIGESALRGRSRMAQVPEWLEKWAALIMEYVQLEQALLPEDLLALRPPYATYTPASAAAEAKGVADNRLQNVVITLDKLQLCLERPGQPQGAPLRLATDEEVLQHLWTGDRSVAGRLLRCAAGLLLDGPTARALSGATSLPQLQALLRQHGPSHPNLQRLADAVLVHVASPEEAKAQLLVMVEVLRQLDVERQGGHTAAADMAYLYAMTQVWFTVERNYKGFSSPRVRLPSETSAQSTTSRLQKRRASEALGLEGGLSQLLHKQGPLREVLTNGTNSPKPDSQGCSVSEEADYASDAHQASSSGRAAPSSKPKSRLARLKAGSQDLSDAAVDAEVMAPGEDPLYDPSEASPAVRTVAPKAQSHSRPSSSSSNLVKKYGALFIWGQLSGWFKQTVYDPTASLSAERRGTLSLPDPDSCYSSTRQYTAKEREEVLQHVEKRPESMWKINTMWSFRNESKMYGSPMFDAVWARTTSDAVNRMPQVIASLRQAPVPAQYKK